MILRTERLVLRRWQPGDAEPFAALNADPEVTRFVGGPMTREASDAMVARFEAFLDERGYGRWAVEEAGTLVGFAGLGTHPFVGGAIEIGWRLARHAWGRGVATEAARAVVDVAFGEAGLDRIVAVVHPDNAASIGVCRKLGMTLAEERDGLVVYALANEPVNELTTSRSEPANSGSDRSAP